MKKFSDEKEETLEIEEKDRLKLFKLKKLLPVLEKDIFDGIMLLARSYTEVKFISEKYKDLVLEKQASQSIKHASQILASLQQGFKTLKIDDKIFGNFEKYSSEEKIIEKAVKQTGERNERIRKQKFKTK